MRQKSRLSQKRPMKRKYVRLFESRGETSFHVAGTQAGGHDWARSPLTLLLRALSDSNVEGGDGGDDSEFEDGLQDEDK